jgi:hypothetical protein
MVYNVIGAAAGVALGHGAMLILTPRSVTYRMEF